MLTKKELDIITNDVIWSYEECGMKIPQNILDILNKIKQMVKNYFTLDECIEEWERKRVESY